MPSSIPDSAHTIDHLLPLADRVNALTRASSRAVASCDAALASKILATDGECERCDSAVRDAWSNILGAAGPKGMGQASALELLVSLEKIAGLAASLCRQVIRLSAEPPIGELPSIRKLTELVPEMLGDALKAVRANDRSSAQKVMDRTISVDACYAQAQLDLLQVARSGSSPFGVVQHFHALGRALERISDNATEIAASVRNSVAAVG